MWSLLAALQVAIIAGGDRPEQNFHSHAVHVRALAATLEAAGVDRGAVAIFWADGTDPAPDRAVVAPAELDTSDWLLHGTEIGEESWPGLEVRDTRFDGWTVFPARRDAIREWLRRLGRRLKAGDTLLIAVTDHGEADPEGGMDTRISLWGESWSVEALGADLGPIAPEVRVVLWMSQCFSGGFADLHGVHPNLCGAFSANPDRVAYGCDPELAQREDVGHFLHLLRGLERHGHLLGATNEAMQTDDTPDTPHLTSDAFLSDALAEQTEATAVDFGALVARHPPSAAAVALGARYRLGDVGTYDAAMKRADDAWRLSWRAAAWRADWARALDAARADITAGLSMKAAEGASRTARVMVRRALAMAAAGRARTEVEQWARVRLLRSRIEAIDERVATLEIQESAAIRAAYLHARQAAPALPEPDRARYDALVRCESAPLLRPKGTRPLPEPTSDRPALRGAAPLPEAAAPLERLRPSWVGARIGGSPGAPEGTGGASVAWVRPGGAADLAGVVAGDRIVSVAGAPIADRAGWLGVEALLRPGEAVPFELIRAGQRRTVQVRAVPRPVPALAVVPSEPVGDLELAPAGVGAGAVSPADPGRDTVLLYVDDGADSVAATRALARWARRTGARALVIAADEATLAVAAPKKIRGVERAVDWRGTAARTLALGPAPLWMLVDSAGRLVQEAEGWGGTVPFEAAR